MYTQPTSTDLRGMLGKKIAEICPCGYNAAGSNHCAHFVSHVTRYQFGYTCFDETGRGTAADRASIRVTDLFSRCRTVGEWANKPAYLLSGLIFVTDRRNVHLARKTLDNVRDKHVGFFLEGSVWHYSNAAGEVVVQTPEQYSHHYPGNMISMFYGEYPI